MRHTPKILRSVVSAAFLITILSVGVPLLTAGAEEISTDEPGTSCNLSLAQALKSLPAGNWTLSITPYFGPGWDAIPVDVSSVTTEATKGLTAESVLLRNLDTRKVVGIKFRWYLREKQGSTALQKGETPLLDANIPAGGEQRLSYDVVTFSAIAPSIAKGGKLNGDFTIEVLAGSVIYEDGSVWNVDQILKGEPTWQVGGKPRKEAIISRPDHGMPDIILNGTMVMGYVKTTGTLPSPQGCQDQSCDYCASCNCYQCNPAGGGYCRVNSCTSCTNSRCLRSGCTF
jgi:hypothetical protein